MHRDAGDWRHGRGISPSVLSKRCATGAEVPFHQRCRSRLILRMRFFARKIIARMSPNVPEKLFVQLLPAIFLPQRSSRPFFGVTSKKALHVFFCKPWAPFFEASNVGCHFYPDFRGFCPDFQQIKTFGGALAPSPPTPLLFITVS